MDDKLRKYFIEINKLMEEALNNYKSVEDFKLFIHYIIITAADYRNKVSRNNNEESR